MRFYTAFALVLLAAVAVKNTESRSARGPHHRSRSRPDHDSGGSSHRLDSEAGGGGMSQDRHVRQSQSGDGDFNFSEPGQGDKQPTGSNQGGNEESSGTVHLAPIRPPGVGGEEEDSNSQGNQPTPNPASTIPCNCPKTPEYNPVCGTNNVTYSNPKALECARSCNQAPGVQIAYRAACVDRPRT